MSYFFKHQTQQQNSSHLLLSNFTHYYRLSNSCKCPENTTVPFEHFHLSIGAQYWNCILIVSEVPTNATLQISIIIAPRLLRGVLRELWSVVTKET